MKLKGDYYETQKVTFPHKVVKTHQNEHMIRFPDGVKIARCDGTVKGAQG